MLTAINFAQRSVDITSSTLERSSGSLSFCKGKSYELLEILVLSLIVYQVYIKDFMAVTRFGNQTFINIEFYDLFSPFSP